GWGHHVIPILHVVVSANDNDFQVEFLLDKFPEQRPIIMAPQALSVVTLEHVASEGPKIEYAILTDAPLEIVGVLHLIILELELLGCSPVYIKLGEPIL